MTTIKVKTNFKNIMPITTEVNLFLSVESAEARPKW